MENKNPLRVLLASALFLACLFVSASASAQENDNCQWCSCSSTALSGGCSTGKCCLPNVPSCDCTFFGARCACTAAMMPTVNEEGVTSLVRLLNSGSFTSPQAGFIAQNLPTLVKANQMGNADLYFATVDRLNETGRQLPNGEKQLINNWAIARGSRTLLP